MGSNADVSGCSSSKRQHVSANHENQYLTTPTNNPISGGDFLPNTGNSSDIHVSSQNNCIDESGASSYWIRKRTRGLMPMGRNADASGSSSSTRQCL
ncbi:hypothetical protein Tco_0392235, partial [Tanacetum coccineum]